MEDLAIRKVITKSGGTGKHATLQAALTKEGLELAERIWNEVDGEYRETAKRVKDKILPLDPKHLREMVHSEYPEYRLMYTELDE